MSPPIYPTPPPATSASFADERKRTAEWSAAAPRNRALERAFLTAKIHALRTDPRRTPAARTGELQQLLPRVAKELVGEVDIPPPGGVGYGMFYEDAFRTSFQSGTAISCEYICPVPPGGNVSTFLYLTATNRASKGVEAFVAYNGQNEVAFRIFDWARPDSDHWQTNLPYAQLTNYLFQRSSHGTNFVTLPVMNYTFEVAPSQWRNQAFLRNKVTDTWDLVYQYDYSSTIGEQTQSWVGSWGPIVETFQDAYVGTNAMGALDTMLASMNPDGTWTPWSALSGSESHVRVDNKGFSVVFLDANHDWAVQS